MVDEKPSDGEETGRLPRRGWPIAYLLAALAFITLFPAIVFSAVLLERNNRAQEEIVQTLIVGTSRAIVQAVEREITANITTLRVLAFSPALLEGDLAAFHAQVTAALQGTGAYVYVLDDSFHSIVSTRAPYEEGSVASTDPDTARRALETGDVVVSDLVLGKVSQRWVVNVLLPLTREGKPPLVMGFNRNADNLSAALLSNKMPEGWNAALIDSQDQVIAASAGPVSTGDAFDLFDVDALKVSAEWNNIDTASGPQRAVVQSSLLTGWRLVAWAPAATLARPLSDAVVALMAGGVLLAALVIAVVFWISRQISRSVRGLARDARLLGAGYHVPERGYPIAEVETVSQAIVAAARQRQAAEGEVRFLMRELAHRSKNQMTVIAAMAKQSAKSADTVPHFVDSFQKRILGLSRSTDLLMAHGKAGVDLKELLNLQIDAFGPDQCERLQVEGPQTRINSQAAQTLGMAAHELATNAVKHGAFANDTGTLSVTWRHEGDRLKLVWREYAGSVVASDRRGFGTTVLETMVSGALKAKVTRTLHRDGIEWAFDMPLALLAPDKADEVAAAEAVEREAERPAAE